MSESINDLLKAVSEIMVILGNVTDDEDVLKILKIVEQLTNNEDEESLFG